MHMRYVQSNSWSRTSVTFGLANDSYMALTRSSVMHMIESYKGTYNIGLHVTC